MIAFHNRTHGKRMEVLFADDCVLRWRREEDGIVGINKCAFDRSVVVDTQNKLGWHRTYRDSLDATNSMNITTGSLAFALPSRAARLW
jgi:alpha-amylase